MVERTIRGGRVRILTLHPRRHWADAVTPPPPPPPTFRDRLFRPYRRRLWNPARKWEVCIGCFAPAT